MKYSLLSILIIFFFTVTLTGQNIITGFVTDDAGKALPGVTVLAKGTKIATITDKEGKFKIEVGPYVNTLIFSYIGMKTVEKEITGHVFNIMMFPDDSEIDEVVVTSLGIRKEKKSLGYATKSDRRKGKVSKVYAPVESSKDYSYEIDDSGSKGENKNEVKSGLLTAGELNDYGKWKLWQDISGNELKTYKSIWKMKPQERYCVQVTSYDDRPIVNAKVHLKTKKGDIIWTGATDNTGKTELWLNIYDSIYNSKDLVIEVKNKSQSFKLNKPDKFHSGINFINIPAKCQVPDEADIAFVVDATGSMGDEIAYLKAELEDVLKKIKKNHKDIHVNTASVFYRDKTDEYLVKKSDFSDNVKTTIEFITNQSAGGGGDFPEAVDAGLHTAINELTWSENALTKVIFLILDAPPHDDAESIKKIQELTRTAAKKGIRIVPVTASGIDKSTEYLMRSVALATNGTYVFLTDDSGIGNAHIKPTTDEFQVEFLNDVFIRLIKQYLTIPECGEEIIFDEEEIQDTSFIADNYNKSDTLINNVDSTNTQINIVPGKVKYYPNPTIDILNIEFTGDMNEMFLADVSGKILQKFDIKNQNKFTISLSNYPSGIYFIQYQNGERWQTGKIIHADPY